LARILERGETTDVRGIHRIRVASRRLRELLPVLQLDRDTAGKVGRRLRKLTRRLGRFRELDVLLLLIDELLRSGRFSKSALSEVRSAVQRTRTELHNQSSEKDLASETHRLALKLGSIVERLEKPHPGPANRASRWVLEARVARRAALLKSAVDAAGAVYLPERLHEVRIAQKKLRYGVELLTEMPAGRSNADVRVLKRAQDVLGRLHDLQLLMDQVRRLQVALDPPSIARWRDLDSLVLQLEDECRRLHARYVRVRASLLEICDRLVSPKGGAGTRTASARKAG
jgi:CHAD domain-containing protein